MHNINLSNGEDSKQQEYIVERKTASAQGIIPYEAPIDFEELFDKIESLGASIDTEAT